MSQATTRSGSPFAATSAVRSPCNGPSPSSLSRVMVMPGNQNGARASLATTTCRSVAPRSAASARSAMRTPSTSASPFGIPLNRRAAPPANNTPTHRCFVICRSDPKAAMLGGEVELRRQRPLHDQALDTTARSLLEKASAPVAHDEVVAQLGVRDARDRRLVHRPAAQAALVLRAPLRVAPRTHERALRTALPECDVGVSAAAGTHDACPVTPD